MTATAQVAELADVDRKVSRPKKVLWTLVVNGYSKAITELTFPYMQRFADKIGADFRVISERKFPDFPAVYEKLQIRTLGEGNDWNMFLDADALVHPDMFDLMAHLPRDTVMHHGADPASLRFRPDRLFRRDGRNIGSCNWFAVASDLCIDLWDPLDLPLEEAVQNIFPTANERASGVIEAAHLIDDYTLSRNIARYGLKVQTLTPSPHDPEGMIARLHIQGHFFWHKYTISAEQKIVEMKQVIQSWNQPVKS